MEWLDSIDIIVFMKVLKFIVDEKIYSCMLEVIIVILVEFVGV